MAVGDSVTQAQFYEEMGKIRDQMQAHHKSQRELIDAKTAAIVAVFEKHEEKDAAVEKRVTIIETERGMEKQQAARQGALYGIAAGASVNVLIIAVKRLFGWES